MKKSAKPPIDWTNAIFFGLVNALTLTAVPLWGFIHGFTAATWIAAVSLWILGGLSITVGYHRMWSHRAFKARWPARLFFAVFGAMALQNSIRVWAARHRVHHRHVDDPERDPHSIRSGFWHAHIGWMLRHWPTTQVDFSQIPDLDRDPIVRWQHRHYWALVWSMNLGIPLALGALTGEFIGMLLLAGVARLTISHHLTFFINSLAHTWGARPYSEDNTAVDNPVVALLTWGEGYHNYHHAFQNDYRNGIRWWQFDPSKWLINAFVWTGLAYDRRRVPNFRIQRARLNMEFERLKRRVERPRVQQRCRELFEREYQQFKDTVAQWQEIQRSRLENGAEALRDRWHRTELATSLRELEFRLKLQHKRLRALTSILEPHSV